MQRRNQLLKSLFLLCFFVLSASHSISQGVWMETKIYMSDGIALDARIVKPLGFPPSGGFPGVILIHGYGGNKDQMQTVQVAIAAYGYASLAYSVRGQGNSEGLSTTSGPRERDDLLAVIQFFRGISDINPDKLGVVGGSQGGIHSWMAAVHRMPGVKVVAPLIATPDFASALIPNGCVKVGLPREMTVSTVRYSPDCDIVKGYIIADQYDSIRTYVDDRDLQKYVGNVEIPVLQGLGWGDILFPTNGGIKARDTLRNHHVPVWSFLGTNGHGQPIDPEGVILGMDKVVEWFDHWLKGFSLDQDSIPMVFYIDDQLTASEMTTAVWPPASALSGRWYITQGGLSQDPPTNGQVAKLPFTIRYDSSYTGEMAWSDEYGGTRFVQAFPSTPLRLVSPPFGSTEEFTGTPTGLIYVESDASKFQVHIRIYDVKPDVPGGTWTLISRSINGVRNNSAGEVHELAIEATGISHFIPAGDMLGLEMTSLDMLDDSSANTIPYLMPASSFLLTSLIQPSYIQLGDVPVSVRNPAQVGLPRQFVLEQNFPNPFNPKTAIRFQLSAASDVRLVVYDLLGREVTVLVNEKRGAGNYEVTFDASVLASGVYIYRLAAGGYVGSRKMVLAK
jgi:predicted acyl esterase